MLQVEARSLMVVCKSSSRGFVDGTPQKTIPPNPTTNANQLVDWQTSCCCREGRRILSVASGKGLCRSGWQYASDSVPRRKRRTQGKAEPLGPVLCSGCLCISPLPALFLPAMALLVCILSQSLPFCNSDFCLSAITPHPVIDGCRRHYFVCERDPR